MRHGAEINYHFQCNVAKSQAKLHHRARKHHRRNSKETCVRRFGEQRNGAKVDISFETMKLLLDDERNMFTAGLQGIFHLDFSFTSEGVVSNHGQDLVLVAFFIAPFSERTTVNPNIDNSDLLPEFIL
jgi:hypothetical protein